VTDGEIINAISARKGFTSNCLSIYSAETAILGLDSPVSLHQARIPETAICCGHDIKTSNDLLKPRLAIWAPVNDKSHDIIRLVLTSFSSQGLRHGVGDRFRILTLFLAQMDRVSTRCVDSKSVLTHG
jgi:hypothetical protein